MFYRNSAIEYGIVSFDPSYDATNCNALPLSENLTRPQRGLCRAAVASRVIVSGPKVDCHRERGRQGGGGRTAQRKAPNVRRGSSVTPPRSRGGFVLGSWCFVLRWERFCFLPSALCFVFGVSFRIPQSEFRNGHKGANRSHVEAHVHQGPRGVRRGRCHLC